MSHPHPTAYDVYKQKYYRPFFFSRNENSQKTFVAGDVYELQTPIGSNTHVIVDLIVQFCCQFESPIVFGMSSGQKILLPENTPTSSLPALAAQTMAAGRVKHLVIEDGPSLLATLQLLISRGVTDKHVLLVIYSLTPVLMMQQSCGHVEGVFRLLREFADSSLAFVVWVTSESPSGSAVRGRSNDVVAQAWKKNFSKTTVLLR